MFLSILLDYCAPVFLSDKQATTVLPWIPLFGTERVVSKEENLVFPVYSWISLNDYSNGWPDTPCNCDKKVPFKYLILCFLCVFQELIGMPYIQVIFNYDFD